MSDVLVSFPIVQFERLDLRLSPKDGDEDAPYEINGPTASDDEMVVSVMGRLAPRIEGECAPVAHLRVRMSHIVCLVRALSVLLRDGAPVSGVGFCWTLPATVGYSTAFSMRMAELTIEDVPSERVASGLIELTSTSPYRLSFCARVTGRWPDTNVSIFHMQSRNPAEFMLCPRESAPLVASVLDSGPRVGVLDGVEMTDGPPSSSWTLDDD